MTPSSSRIVTYSPAYTLVPTYECFNQCAYCNFRAEPGTSPWLTLADAEKTLTALQGHGVIEMLVLSGEVHPLSGRRSSWFQHIYTLCELAISLGFLPHANVGPLSFEEMKRLRLVNVSMGLMLEQLTPDLLKTVHRHAPSKLPEVRLQQLAWAGELKIPFTTGLLLGLGETKRDRQESLMAIAQIQEQWGHIQEVILQPYRPGQQEALLGEAFQVEELLETIDMARQILPEAIAIQVPPNLVQDPQMLIACLEMGARDVGGISPRDEVNPDYPHPHIQEMLITLNQAGWEFLPRLPVYPQYDDWLPAGLRERVQDYRFDLSNLT
ncbi:MAG: 7,8-didemethyl-8-hydroxy-5-deazariboflavin synthase subunit CofG [Leptolyngbyaceae cyanobacterium SU_3_3]|nr:7,8-didemethyl-8-hydroxy-5-deazariboflavin synthase subunit CofG [Leptolyngbyaceae cyanobacterium SU_3_3]NJR50045.1 7,8-didemethyl-8-hydroxy-5-deazariboflavin synthase subunit CofG [Leptolyngbyaceae cyanobacterium CSU_1_3]